MSSKLEKDYLEDLHVDVIGRSGLDSVWLRMGLQSWRSVSGHESLSPAKDGIWASSAMASF